LNIDMMKFTASGIMRCQHFARGHGLAITVTRKVPHALVLK